MDPGSASESELNQFTEENGYFTSNIEIEEIDNKDRESIQNSDINMLGVNNADGIVYDNEVCIGNEVDDNVPNKIVMTKNNILNNTLNLISPKNNENNEIKVNKGQFVDLNSNVFDIENISTKSAPGAFYRGGGKNGDINEMGGRNNIEGGIEISSDNHETNANFNGDGNGKIIDNKNTATATAETASTAGTKNQSKEKERENVRNPRDVRTTKLRRRSESFQETSRAKEHSSNGSGGILGRYIPEYESLKDAIKSRYIYSIFISTFISFLSE